MNNDLTQVEISTRLGIKPQSYQQYETGRATPPGDKLAKLADTFGVTVDYLLGREGEAGSDAGPITDAVTRSTQQACIAEFNLALTKSAGDLPKLEALRASLQRTHKNW